VTRDGDDNDNGNGYDNDDGNDDNDVKKNGANVTLAVIAVSNLTIEKLSRLLARDVPRSESWRERVRASVSSLRP